MKIIKFAKNTWAGVNSQADGSNAEKLAKIAAQVLRAGGLVIFPTETTYGAGVDATNPEAVKKLLRYKSGRQGKPLSIAVDGLEMAKQFVDMSGQAKRVWDKFLPGPVTLVAKGKGRVAPGVESEFGTLGVRYAGYPLVGQIVSQLGSPITATSANSSGKKTPYSIDDVVDNLSDRQKSLVDLVIDAGTLPKTPPSTVIDTTLSTPITLRQGQIKTDTKRDNLANKKFTTIETKSLEETKQLAGKLLLKHWEDVKKTGLVICLNGPLGAGKTIFSKGVGEFLQINEDITSPTYTYIEEYDFMRHGVNGKFFHLDMWKVDNQFQFDRLDFDKLLGPNQVVVIEWWDQVKEFAQEIVAKSNCPQLTIDIQDTGNQTRKLTIYE